MCQTPHPTKIWDTAGQERFRTITSSYYRGASGIIVVYDVSNRASFESVRRWCADIDKFAATDVNKLLVGNKTDLPAREVGTSEGQALAAQLGMPFLETSARDSVNVEAAFLAMARDILERRDKQGPHSSQAAGPRHGQVDLFGAAEYAKFTKRKKSCCSSS